MMDDVNSRNIGYPSQLAIFLGLTGAGLIIGTLVSVGVWMMMTGRPVLTIETDMLNPAYYYADIVVQAVSTFFMFFLVAYFFAMICYKKQTKYLGYNLRINFKQILLVTAILVLSILLITPLSYLNEHVPLPKDWIDYFNKLENKMQAQEAILIQVSSLSRYLISLFIIGFLPALFEETFFRGGLQNFLTRWFKSPLTAIIVTAIIFSLVHLSYSGFLLRFALGIILGYIFYYSGSLWLSILCHFLFNGLQVTEMYILTIKHINNSKGIESNFPLWVGLIALMLLLYLFRLFKHTSEIEKAKHLEEDNRDDELSWITN